MPAVSQPALTVSARRLDTALARLVRMVDRKSTIPILSHVRLAAPAGGTLSLAATDLEASLAIELDADIAEAIDIAVPALMLAQFAKGLPDGDVRLRLTEGDRLSLSAGRTRAVLPTLPASQWPAVTEPEWRAPVTFPGALTAAAIEATIIAAEIGGKNRFYLDGIYLCRGADGRAVMVATDGHRLVRRALPTVLPEQWQGIIIPSRTAPEIARLAKEAGELSVSVDVGDGRLRVAAGNIVLASKLVDGNYPDYERVIPRNNSRHAQLARGDLVAALARVMPAISDKGSGIAVAIEAGRIGLAAGNGTSTAEDELDVDGVDWSLDIGLSGRLLASVLDILPDGRLDFAFEDPGSPVLIRPVVEAGIDDDTMAIVMPMRLSNIRGVIEEAA